MTCQSVGPALAGSAGRGLIRRLVNAIRRRRVGAAAADASERKRAVMKRDLAYLDRHQLRDIGLDRDSL